MLSLAGTAYLWLNGTLSTVTQTVIQVRNKINGMKILLKRNSSDGSETKIDIKTFYNLVKFAGILAVKVSYYRLWQYLNQTLEQINRNTFVLTYTLNGNLYKVPLKIKRGPSPVLYVHNEKNEDLTDVFLQYAGPFYDFHNQRFTPSYFDSKTLFIELSNGTYKQYEEHELMSIDY